MWSVNDVHEAFSEELGNDGGVAKSEHVDDVAMSPQLSPQIDCTRQI